MGIEEYQSAVRLWQSWNIRTAAELDRYLENFRILFAYHSGKIENENITYNDTREIFENGRVIGYTGDTRTLFEQQNQKLCYEALKEKLAAKEPLSAELVKEIHCMLASGTYDERRYIVNGERPGEFKKHDYVIGINESGSPPETVKDDLEELLAEVTEAGGRDPLKAGTYLHARFEFIHPFADGNGRVGRTLLNYWLIINDYPPLIVYDEDKKDYYEALRQYDESELLHPLESFFRGQTVKTWSRALEQEKEKNRRQRSLVDFL